MMDNTVKCLKYVGLGQEGYIGERTGVIGHKLAVALLLRLTMTEVHLEGMDII